MFAIAPAIALMLAGGLPAHRVVVEHGGQAYTIDYQPVITTRLRTIGASSGSRPSTERCRWTATFEVIRKLGSTGAEPVALPVERTLSGSHPGHCSQARAAVEAQIAAATGKLRSHLVALSQEDLPSARADIELGQDAAGN